jgi:hypothetical protein
MVMTYRERREARAARLREWAAKREDKAAASLAAEPSYRHDWAFITQPGPISERTRMNARDERRYESLAKAEEMRAKVDNIEAAADRAIYSDDPDAREQLERRIAGLEAERRAILAYNADCRAKAKTGGHGDLKLLEWDSPAGLRSIANIVEDCARAGQLRPGWALPAYASSNLSGNIARLRKRLAELA